MFNKPCQPISSSITVRNTDVYFSWTGCSRTSGSKVAPTVKYLVSCVNVVRIQSLTWTTINVYNLCPNKRYLCYVYGIDNLGRLGVGQSFDFTTTKIGKFVYYVTYFTGIIALDISLRLP